MVHKDVALAGRARHEDDVELVIAVVRGKPERIGFEGVAVKTERLDRVGKRNENVFALLRETVDQGGTVGAYGKLSKEGSDPGVLVAQTVGLLHGTSIGFVALVPDMSVSFSAFKEHLVGFGSRSANAF